MIFFAGVEALQNFGFRGLGSGSNLFSQTLRNSEKAGFGGQCQLSCVIFLTSTFLMQLSLRWFRFRLFLFDFFRDFCDSNFSRTSIVVVVHSNQIQLLSTYNTSGSAAERLILGTIPGCGNLFAFFL